MGKLKTPAQLLRKKQKPCIAVQAKKHTVKLLGTKKNCRNNCPTPTPYSYVLLITSQISHAILVLLNGFRAVNCCIDHALPLQIKLTVVSPLLLFLATITRIL